MADRTQQQQQDGARGPVLPPHTEDHGHSLAAWVGVGLVILGAAIASLAVVFTAWPFFWAGIGLALVAPLVGKVLAMKGHGAATPVEQSSDAPHDAPHNLHGTR